MTKLSDYGRSPQNLEKAMKYPTNSNIGCDWEKMLINNVSAKSN